MGQKVNPVGLRLGINRTWDSRWFANTGEYGKLLHEDMKIRETLMKLLKQAAEPGGIKSRHSRVRLYQMMGNISPAPETANIWRAALEKRLEEKTAPRTPAVSSKKAPARGKGGKFGGKPAGGGKPLMKSQSPEPEVAVIRRRVVSPKLAAPVQPRRIVRPTDDD